jgi:Ca2+-binding RTX toxin-like protein
MATITGAAADEVLLGTAAADVIYGLAGNDTLLGCAGDDTLIGGAGADALVGGDGVDVASYASASTGVTINLATGAHAGDAAGDTFDGIEIIQGSNLADLFVANAAVNRLDGSGGWSDTISYEASSSAVSVNLTTNLVSGGDAEGDTISGFEKVIGSAYDDTLASGSPGNILQQHPSGRSG